MFYEWATRRYVGRLSAGQVGSGSERALLLIAAALAIAFAIARLVVGVSPGSAAAIPIVALAVYAWLAWRYVLRPNERLAWARMLRR